MMKALYVCIAVALLIPARGQDLLTAHNELVEDLTAARLEEAAVIVAAIREAAPKEPVDPALAQYIDLSTKLLMDLEVTLKKYRDIAAQEPTAMQLDAAGSKKAWVAARQLQIQQAWEKSIPAKAEALNTLRKKASLVSIPKEAIENPSGKRIVARVLRVLPQGLFVYAANAPIRLSGSASRGHDPGESRAAAAYALENNSEVEGEFLIVGHPAEDRIADGDQIRVSASEISEVVKIGPRTFRAYKVVDLL